MAFTQLTTVADIEAYFLNVDFSDSESEPTESEVNKWIDQATSIIYGVIQEKYIIPVTDADDLLILQEICDMYVLTKVRAVLGKTTSKILANGKLNPIEETHDEFFKRLDMIMNCEIQLHNTELQTSKLDSYSFNSVNNIQPVAKKYTDQW